MSNVTMIIQVDFIKDGEARESLCLNIVTTGDNPSDATLTEIIADEVAEHLAKHKWELP